MNVRIPGSGAVDVVDRYEVVLETWLEQRQEITGTLYAPGKWFQYVLVGLVLEQGCFLISQTGNGSQFNA